MKQSICIMQPRALWASLIAALSVVSASAAFGQAPRPLITSVDSSVRQVLAGSVPSIARPEFDQGEAPAGTRLTRVSLLLGRSPARQAALEHALDAINDPTSPAYHRWLTPEEFGRLYGPADADIAAITGWLESEGLTDIVVPRSRSLIQFSGSVGLVEQVFHTSIHSFERNGRQFLSNINDPSIPAALAPVVKGIVDLDTIAPEPSLVVGPAGVIDPATHRLVRADRTSDGPEPRFTGTLGSEPFLYITPADAATLYNTPNKSLNANFSATSSYDGKGITIGIIGDAGLASSQTAPIVNWRKLFLPSSYGFNLAITNVDGATSTNALDEAFLDIETAGGIAPGAAFHFYTSADSILPAITQALDDNTVDILNVSFGKCEQTAGNTANQAILAAWQQAAMQGISVTVSAGDTGSARCDTNGTNEAAEGLAVSYYASTPYNIAVGGTDTWGLVDNFNDYVDPSTDNSAKGYYRTLLKPVPEATWNDSQDNASAVPGPISKAVVYQYTTQAGGGGASSCSTQSSAGKCTSGYPKPSWQSGAGVPKDGVRDLPDVALMSGVGYDSATWVVCSPDLGSCTVESGGFISFHGVGGTSAAAPAFAGMLALVEQKTGDRLGSGAVGELYTLYRYFGSRVFNDITLGNNAPPCYAPSTVFPSPDCVKNSAGYYFESAYNAGAGYDQASGLGSVNVTNLVELWGAAAPQHAIVSVKLGSATSPRAEKLSVTVAVSGSSGTPTGQVTLTSGIYTSSAVSLTAGKATIVIPANTLPVGSDTLTASYTGDAKFSPGTGAAEVKVVKLAPEVTVTPATLKPLQNSSLAVTVKVAAAAGIPTGTVALSGGSYKSATRPLADGSFKFTIPAGRLAIGKDTITATYSGDTDDNAATGKATVTVSK